MGIDTETWRHRDKKRDKGTQRQRDGVRHRLKKDMERDRETEKRWREKRN